MKIAQTISAYNRKRKWKLFKDIIGINPNQTILDVGFTEREYSPYDNFIEKNYPYPEKITALGVDNPYSFKKRYPLVKVVIYNGNTFPFKDLSFDIIWSNAVIEHVGSKEAQLNFLKEVKRVGKKSFITTPNRNFPIELHTKIPLLHLFFNKQTYDSFLILIGKDWASGNYMNLLSKRNLIDLLFKAGIHQYKIISNRFFGLTMDFVIIF